jgi:hypothetical protein
MLRKLMTLNNENHSRLCRPKPAPAKWSGLVPLLAIVSFLILAACKAAPLKPDSETMVKPVTVRIDNTIEYQEIAGFGATTLAGIMGTGNGVRDLLDTSLRDQAIEAVYGDVGLNLGNLQLWQEPSNDNDDPLIIKKDGFRWAVSDAMYELLVRPARSYGFSDYSLGLTIDMRRELHWMKELRKSDYSRYLQEVAEYVVAGVAHWQEITGNCGVAQPRK